MMTTIVRKGQNRKAAEAKRAKHAQRTPLPTLDLPADATRGLNSSTASKIKEIAPVTVKQCSSTDDFDKMSLSQLRQLTRAQGRRGTEHATKEAMVDTIRKHPPAAPMDAAPLGVSPTKTKEDDGGEMTKTKTRRT